MRKYLSVFLAYMMLAQAAWANPIPSNVVDIGDGTASNKRIRASNGATPKPELRWNNSLSQWEFSNDGTNFIAIGSGGAGDGGINLLGNGNFDQSTNEWTATGSSTLVVNTNAGVGNSATWDATATGEALQSDLYTVPEILKGNQCIAFLKYQWTAGTADDLLLQAVDGASNILSQKSIAVTTSTTPWTEDFVVFDCPTSGQIRLRLIASSSATNPAAIDVKSLHLGSNIRSVKVDGASVAGVAYFATTASCNWSRTNTALGDFGAVAACPGPTVLQSGAGIWQTTDTDLPQWTINSLPPGHYIAVVDVSLGTGSGIGASVALSDGTDTRGPKMMQSAGGAETNGTSLVASFTYLTAGNRTFKMQGSADSGAVTIWNSTTNAQLRLTLYRFPLNAQSAISFDEADWHVDAFITGASNLNKTTTTGGYVEWADAGLAMTLASGSAPAQIGCTTGTAPEGLTCNTAAVNESVAVAFTPPYAGIFEVCARYNLAKNIGTGGDISVRNKILETGLTDQTLVGSNQSDASASSLLVSSTAPTIGDHDGYSICKNMEFSSVSKKLVRLQTNVTSVQEGADLYLLMDNSLDGVRWTVRPVTQYKAGINFNNLVSTGNTTGDRIQRAQITGGNPPTITSQSGNWLTFNTRTGAGDYTFDMSGFSARPVCQCTRLNGDDSNDRSYNCNLQSISSSQFRIHLRDRITTSTTLTDGNVEVTCQGAK